MMDVASLAGVSQATVSLVLNGTPGARLSDATKKKVRQAAEDIGYRLARREQRHPAAENGVIAFIADEVATGFGRTGTMFACQGEEVSPDLICLAKGLTGGYLPLAATLTTEHVYSAFLGPPAEGRTFYYGHTYTGNPLGCAVALASLDLFDTDRVMAHLTGKVDRLTRVLADTISPLRHVADVRQRGLMVGIELAADPVTQSDLLLGDIPPQLNQTH